jgi:hypothetical protein
VVRGGIAVAVLMLFFYLHLELNRSLTYFYPPMRMPVLTLLWVGLCTLALLAYLTDRSRLLLGFLIALVTGLLVKLFVFDLVSWKVAVTMRYGHDYSFLDGGMRLVDFATVIVFFGMAFSLLAGDMGVRAIRMLFGALAVALGLVWSTLELNTFLYYFVPGLRAGGVSILWSLFALGLILAGIRRDARELRFVGLC